MCKEGQVQSMAQVCSNRSNLLKRGRQDSQPNLPKLSHLRRRQCAESQTASRRDESRRIWIPRCRLQIITLPMMLRNSWHILIQVIISSCIVFTLVLSISWRVARYSHRSCPYRTPRVGDMQRKEGDVEREGKFPELCHS